MPATARNLTPRLRGGLAIWGICLWAGILAAAEPGPLVPPRIMTGHSRQMTVVGYDPGSPWGAPSLSNVRDGYLQMDPAVALLSAERIKAEFLRQFNREDLWRGLISIIIQGRVSPDEDIIIRSEYGMSGWRFKIQVPGQTPRIRFMRAVVRALLLEIANRQNRSSRLVEVPLWLQEGIAAHLFETRSPTLVMENRTRLDFMQELHSGLGEARQHFRVRSPLTFAELSLPHESSLEGMGWTTYQHSAHLFVAELLRLPEGGKGLWRTLELLPGYLNQQLAFQKAFADRFARSLDIEKWWSVTVVSFIAREENLRWSQEKSLERLEMVFRKPVQVRLEEEETPQMRSIALQELIRKTTYAEHKPLLIDTINQMTIVQANSQRDLARLIADYREALMKYVRSRDGGVLAAAGGSVARESVIEQLDLLDDIRADFRKLAMPVPKDESIEAAERLLEQR